MIKIKITLELEQIVEAFENALKGCGFDLNGKKLEFKDNDNYEILEKI